MIRTTRGAIDRRNDGKLWRFDPQIMGVDIHRLLFENVFDTIGDVPPQFNP